MISHTPEWLIRKFKQASKEKFQESQLRSVEVFRGVALLADQMLNKGKAMDKILPPFEESGVSSNQIDEQYKNHVTGTWWKKGGD